MARSNSIYVMTGPDGLTKVGIASETRARRIALERQSGESIEVAYERFLGPACGWIERRAHDKLKEAGCHSHSEWFRASVEQCVSAIDEAIAEHEGAKAEYDEAYRRAHSEDFNVDACLDLIRIWLKASGVSAHRLGVLACANQKAVQQVLEGRGTVQSLWSILDYIDKQAADQKPKRRGKGK